MYAVITSHPEPSRSSHAHPLQLDPGRRRRLGAFTTDAKVIRLTRRRVAFSPTAAAAAAVFRRRLRRGSFQKFPGGESPRPRPRGLFGKGREGSSIGRIRHTPLSVSSLCLKLFSHIIQSTYISCLHHLFPPPKDQSLSYRLETSLIYLNK